MVFDSNAAGSLLEQLRIAKEAEAIAIRALGSALKSGVKNTETLRTLSDQMTEAHNNSMDIWNQLQKFRLDK
jgi:hypothetical protein